MSQKYLKKLDTFCFIFRILLQSKMDWKSLILLKKKMCHTYFGVKPAELDQPLGSSYCFGVIVNQLCWDGGKGWKIFWIWFSYGLPRTKRLHPTEWYFYVSKAVGITSKNKHLIKHPSLPLAVTLVPHSTEIPVSVFKGFFSGTLEPHQCSKNIFLIL